MSASNWDACPRCHKRAVDNQAEATQKAEQAYGKVTAAEYARLCAEAKQPVERTETLREDWEIGVSLLGEFFVIYRCWCRACDFAHEFNHQELLKL